MTIRSFSARQLQDLLRDVTASEMLGTDSLRDLASRTRAATEELDHPGRRVVAWVLARQLEALADRWEADAMTAEDWGRLMEGARTEMGAALAYLNQPAGATPDDALRIAITLIDLTS